MSSMRVPPEQLRRLRVALERWQSPKEFVCLLEETTDQIDSPQYFNDSRAQFALDAWVAARVAMVTEADEVRLCPDEWPDYEERTQGEVAQYEITEADRPGRKRGAEYKGLSSETDASDLRHVSDEEWENRTATALAALQDRAKNKATKCYPRTASLVIHLNVGGVQRDKLEAEMGLATACAKDHFKSILVLWRDGLYRPWHRGEPSNDIIALPDTV